MVDIRARETVILATDFSALVSWYARVLGFTIVKLFEDGFHYCNLETPSGIKIGIADAKEVGVHPADRQNNAVVLQIEVDDLKQFFAHLEQAGASITKGPAYDEGGGFWFGGFADLEGNPIWVVDKNCP